jgi:release factor glutamine methyltransferase
MTRHALQGIKELLQELYPGREGGNIFHAIQEYLINADETQLEEVEERLRKEEPWQYIVGKAWFYGLELSVAPAVLIPRAETEELVHLILSENGQDTLKVLDIGTGSGCIPMALKFSRAHWEVHACDVSGAALAIAEGNAATCGLHVHFFELDILQEEPEGQYDIIVSNPPYIPVEESQWMSASVLEFEPHLALFSGDDPQLFYRRLAEKSSAWLKTGAKIYLELNEFHADATASLFLRNGFSSVELIQDLAGKNRMLKAVL